VFSALQAVILSVAAASFLWLGGMLAAAAPMVALVAALGLLLHDIYVYMQGGDSVIGRIMENGGGLVSMIIEGFKTVFGYLNMLYEAAKLFLIEVVASPLIPMLFGLLVGGAVLIIFFLTAVMILLTVLFRVASAVFYGVIGFVETVLGFLLAIIGALVKIVTLGGIIGDGGWGDWLMNSSLSLLGKGYNEFGNVKGALTGGGVASKMGALYGPTSSNPGTVNNIMVNNTVNSVNAPQTAVAVLNDSMTRVQEKVSYP
jgi:hypothetical protein